jgi:hypothetical protein
MMAALAMVLGPLAACSSVGDFEEDDAGTPGVDAGLPPSGDADAGPVACAVTPMRLPAGRAGWSAASAPDGKIYLVGGTPDFGPEERPSSLFVFDPVTGSSRALTSAPVAFYETPGATFIGDLMMVVNTEVWFYDPAHDAWKQGPATPGGAFMGRAVTTGIDGRVYAFGGRSLYGAATDDAEVYVPGTGWQMLPPVPAPIAEFAAVSISGRLYVIGTSSFVLVSGSGAWYQAATTGVVRRYAAVVVHGASDILAIGGQTPDASTPLATVERFDHASEGWSDVARLPVPVSMAAAATSVSCPGRVYVFGGESPNGVSNAVQVYGPDDSWVLSP